MFNRLRLWLAYQLFRLAGAVAPDGDNVIEVAGGELKISKGKV